MDYMKWLMEGDPSIQYMTMRDLSDDVVDLASYREKIHQRGWCKDLISLRDPETYRWGGGIYGPKWISTTYTMLDLKNFAVDPSLEWYQTSSNLLLEELWVKRSSKKEYPLDLCICGMLLNLCCYAKIEHDAIPEIVDTLIRYHMHDGAWNCALNKKPHHSSLHTTINVLEGLLEYRQNGYTYRLREVENLVKLAHEFILSHHLYQSDKTGKMIHKSFTMLSYPSRWKYDILRAMDYFRKAEVSYDSRMGDALAMILGKRRKDLTWPVQQKYSGLIHFDYEKTGGSSRINTLRVLRILRYYGLEEMIEDDY